MPILVMASARGNKHEREGWYRPIRVLRCPSTLWAPSSYDPGVAWRTGPAVDEGGEVVDWNKEPRERVWLTPGDSRAIRRIEQLTGEHLEPTIRAVVRDRILKEARALGTTYRGLCAAGAADRPDRLPPRLPPGVIADVGTNAVPSRPPARGREIAKTQGCMLICLTPGDSRAIRSIARLTGKPIESIVRAMVRDLILRDAMRLGVRYQTLAQQAPARVLPRTFVVN